MSLCVALLLVSVVGGLTTAQRSPWLSVRDETGSWLTLVEVSPQTEFWLRPQPSLTSSQAIEACGGKSQLSVEVRLWSPESLERARRALIAQGRCSSGKVCRVAPYQVDRIGMRDQQAQWSTAKPWIFVSGVVPATQRFDLRRNSADSANRSDECGLDALVVEMVSRSGRTSAPDAALKFTASDVRWAMRLQQIPHQTFAVVAVERRRLRRLAREVLSVKLSKREAADASFSSIITPSMMKRMENELTQLIVTYDNFKRTLKKSVTRSVFGGRQLAQNEKVYILKRLPDIRDFEIPISRGSEVIRISVSLPRIEINQSRMQATEKVGSIGNFTTVPEMKIEKVSVDTNFQLRQRIEKLEAMVNDLLNTRSNENSNISKKSSKKVKKPRSVTDVDDCSEVKSRGLGGGVYTLRPAGRRVRCTAGGELVALSRTKGNVNFDRDWKAYRDGFGDARTGDYWVGLLYLANYTAAGDRCMRLVMKPWKLKIDDRVVRYTGINIASEEENFRLLYTRWKGNVAWDSLAEMKNQSFTTRDRDNDAFVGNCARVFGGGNWYKSCTSANIFGRHKYLTDTSVNTQLANAPYTEVMCWKGLDRSQGSMCSPLVSAEMIFSSPSNQNGSREVVWSKIASTDVYRCSSAHQRFTAPLTGMYYITAGGGSGGRSTYRAVGGRGALVKAKIFLEMGRKLVIAAGCGGGYGQLGGHGGNATYMIDEKEWKLLFVAGGGGGGADNRISGSDGRAVQSGGDALYTVEERYRLNSTILLRPSPIYRGHSWSSCGRKSKFCMTGAMSKFTHRRSRYRSTIYHRLINGGGGGGGFNGGITGLSRYTSGGGGGSYCDPKLGKNCVIEEGGNRHQVGFLIMEKSACL